MTASNYAMLHRLQAKYAESAVRFLLIPCNQFHFQENGTNAEVKTFAEQSVALTKSGNVVMLAKSNLNHVACTYTGADVCTPASAGCCPKNDEVYDFLLDHTAPGTIKWNFDKIITGKDGKPYAGEQIMHGIDVDKEVSAIIDKLLADGGRQELSVEEFLAVHRSAPLVFGLFGMALVAGLVLGGCALSWGGAKPEEALDSYVRVEA
mmetsp:Transcript_154077/g.493878  ORF Transcript_154077/g.493878 Transcript_154077/m.493878 type:complete len:207 (-) Transcript_154077:193-813(-)